VKHRFPLLYFTVFSYSISTTGANYESSPVVSVFRR